MGIFFNKKEDFNLGNSQVSIGTLPSIHSSMGTAYPIIITDKIINLVLAKLTNPNLFNKSRGLGLEKAMATVFTTGIFKGYMYFKGSELVAITHGENEDKEFASSFTAKKVEVNSTGQMYAIIVEQSCSISNILSNESTNIALASVITYKMKDLRTRVSTDLSIGVHEASKKALEKSKETDLLVIDSEDSVEMMSTVLSHNNQLSVSFAIDNLVLATGFPASFFSGKFANGLGSTSDNERLMTENALVSIFSLYFKKFFMYVSDAIEIEKDLSLVINNSQGLIALAQSDDSIDIKELYRRLGIPLKNK